MNTTTATARIARYIAAPLFLGAAALGMAGMANAATYSQPANPGFNAPGITAPAAPNASPGWHNHHGEHHIENLVHNGFHR